MTDNATRFSARFSSRVTRTVARVRPKRAPPSYGTLRRVHAKCNAAVLLFAPGPRQHHRFVEPRDHNQNEHDDHEIVDQAHHAKDRLWQQVDGRDDVENAQLVPEEEGAGWRSVGEGDSTVEVRICDGSRGGGRGGFCVLNQLPGSGTVLERVGGWGWGERNEATWS